MADYVRVPETDWQDILDAVRGKTGEKEKMLSGVVAEAIATIETGGGSGGGQAFQCGTVVSADGTNLVVPCTLDNILIVRKYAPSSARVAYLLNATLLVAEGLEIQLSSIGSANIINNGIGTFLITKENGQTTFTQTGSIKFTDAYCYIAWDNAE